MRGLQFHRTTFDSSRALWPTHAGADANAFHSIGLDRRKALWVVHHLQEDDALPLFAYAKADELAEEPEAFLPEMSLGEQVAADHQTLRPSLKAHPMDVLCSVFAKEGIATSANVKAAKDGKRLTMGAWCSTARTDGGPVPSR